MPTLRTAAGFTLLACQMLCPPQRLHAHPGSHVGDEHAAEPAKDFLYDRGDAAVQSDVLENPLWYDADVALVDGRPWYAWLEFTPDKGDRIWVGRRALSVDDRQQAPWECKHVATKTYGAYARPTLTADSTGQVWLSYEAESERQWDVFAVPINAQCQPAGVPVRVTPGDGADIHHDVAADGVGGLWFVWQSDVGGQFDIRARHFDGTAWGETFTVYAGPHGEWHPQVVVDSQGNPSVAWDGYDGQSYNVYLRSKRADGWNDVLVVAGTGAFEGRVDLAVDRHDRKWLVWEQGGENWGRPYRGIVTPEMVDQLGPLHRFRRLQLAIVAADGTVRDIPAPLPMPAWEAAEQRTGQDRHAKHTGAFYERGRLAVDDAGRLWLMYRHFYAPWLGFVHKSHVEHGWGVYARYFGQDGWSRLYECNVGQGDGLQRLEVAPAGNGIAAVWTTGRTDRRENSRPRGIVAASVTAASGAGPGKAYDAALPEKERHVADSQEPPVTQKRPTAEVAGQRLQLFYGDLHRHTDLSLCRVPIDGTIDDAYRYASDVAQLDFLGITDHSRDIAMGDALSQLWWRSRKEVCRHELGTRFLPFYAYERSHGNTADHNVISLRPDMLRPHTYPVPTFWEELDSAHTMTIPHQPIRRDTWNYQNDSLRPLLEIYQGCRDSSIEEDSHRGLGKGYRLGFIASSDHMSTSASYACVWAQEPTREFIFSALKARRTFGATSKIQLVVRAGKHWMGEEIQADKLPPLHLKAIGTAPIRTIEFVVDGQVQDVFTPNQREVTLDFSWELVGEHYVYFHLLQADGNQAWSSPLFLTPPE